MGVRHRRTFGELKRCIKQRDNYRCFYCGSRKELTVDHVIPRSRGGTDAPGNLVTCCDACNQVKKAELPSLAELARIFRETDKRNREQLLEGQ